VKPPRFTYHDPRSLTEALEMVATLPNAKVLAGGQSLMPALNMRLAMPDHLVSINRIPELDYVRVEGDLLSIGALTRQRDVEISSLVRERCPLLHEAICQVGHAQTRNRGTVGGSLAHLDPAAELPAVAAAMDAVVYVQSVRGPREIPFDQFAVTYMTTALEPDELLTGVSLQLWPHDSGHAFIEYARRHGDFAVVGVAALLHLGADGTVDRAAIALTGVGPGPVRARQAEAMLLGRRPDEDQLRAAAATAAKEIDPDTDIHATRAHRIRLAEVITRRALDQARERIRGYSHA
jgi:carbon-monoxide dehydrogenase medium subunit